MPDRVLGANPKAAAHFDPVSSGLLSGLASGRVQAIGELLPLPPPQLVSSGGVGVVLRAAGDGLSSPQSFPFTNNVPVGAFLSVLVADAFGYLSTLTGVSDSQGNRYTLDSDVNEADGDGSVFVAHSKIARPLTGADTLTITYTHSPWAHFYVIATAFLMNYALLDVAGTPHGTASDYPPADPQSIDVSVTPNAGDLLIAYAAYERGPVTNDTGHGWSPFLDNDGDPPQNVISAGYQIASGSSPAHYVTTNEDSAAGTPEPGDYGASVICAYKAAPNVGGDNVIVGMMNNTNPPASFPFTTAVPAGSLLMVTVDDEDGWGATISSITDTKGNAYVIDVDGAASDFVTWVAHSFITVPLDTSDHLVIGFDITPWPSAFVAATKFHGFTSLRGVGSVHSAFQSMDATFSGQQPGDLVIGYANFYHATSLTNPGDPWIPFLNDLSVPSAQVTADWLVATDMSTIHYKPAPAPGTGGFDEGVVIAFAP